MTNLKTTFERDGYLSPVTLFSDAQAAKHRTALERAEQKIGSLHYKAKVHTILKSPYELITHPRVLDVVEQLIGPDILIYNAEYIIKEPHTSSHVSWHQDLTYWGFDGEDQISMWLALSPATQQSGCMRMIPGSHTTGMREHQPTDDENNILYQGQSLLDVDESQAKTCALQPGEASFHHGWTVHSSMPNQSDDRRIGLNVQYIKPSMKQLKTEEDSAMLVRGVDKFGHYKENIPAETDLDPAALKRQEELNRIYEDIASSNTIAGKS